MDYQPKSLSIEKPNGLTEASGLPNKNIIDPNVMTSISQLGQLGQLAKLRKLEESKVPTGTKSINMTVHDEPLQIRLSKPWISLSLTNDGPGAVIVEINDPANLKDLVYHLINEMVNIDMKYPVIRSIWLQAAQGTTAIVRIIGKEGKITDLG